MKHNSKILFIAPALSMGGMERAAVNTANGLNESGFEVVFLSLFKKEHFFKLNQKITIIEPNGFNKVSLSLYESIKWIRSEVKKDEYVEKLIFVNNGRIQEIPLKSLATNSWKLDKFVNLYQERCRYGLSILENSHVTPPQNSSEPDDGLAYAKIV